MPAQCLGRGRKKLGSTGGGGRGILGRGGQGGGCGRKGSREWSKDLDPDSAS